MTMASPGIAVVGGGFMATVHSRAARAAGARLLGVVASTPERSAEVATTLGFDRGYPSLEDLLQDPAVDVVHVCTPNALHAEQALAAIAAGKHVICEKPLATDAPTAAHLVEAAERAGVVGTVPFVYRFHPLVREARARIADGALGTLLTINGSYLQDWLLAQTDDNWRVDAASGGRSRAFADIGSHLVDLLEFITGARITELSSTVRTFFAERANTPAVTTEDAAAVVIRLEGGSIGTLLVSQVAPGRKNRLHLEVAGTELSIGFDQEAPETLWLGRRSGTQLLPRDADQLHPDAARLSIVPSGHPMGYQDAFNAFVADSYAAMAGRSPDGLPVFADGLRATRITEAVLDAAADGTWVQVEPPIAAENRTSA